MTYSEILSVTSNWAAILTAVVATTAYGRYLWVQLSQRRTLEGHLRKEKISGVGSGKRTVMHLMANLALTESEVLSAAFRSKKISPVVGVDDKGRADMDVRSRSICLRYRTAAKVHFPPTIATQRNAAYDAGT